MTAAVLLVGATITGSSAQPTGTPSEQDVLAIAQEQAERSAAQAAGAPVPQEGSPEVATTPEAEVSTDLGAGDAPTEQAPQAPEVVPPTEVPDGDSDVPETPDGQASADQPAAGETAQPLTNDHARPGVGSQQRSTDGGGVGIMSVPAASGNNAVITVKVGGTRAGAAPGTVSGIAGVTLRLSNNQAGTNLPTRGGLGMGAPTSAYVECTSDADGDCSFVIPRTSCGFLGCWLTPEDNRDRQFWIVPVTNPAGMTPSGFYDNANLGTSSTAVVAPPGQTGSELRSGNTYRYTLAYSRNNPELVPKCPTGAAVDPLRVALLVDLSGSMNDGTGVQGQTGLSTVKTAARGVLNTLAGPGSTAELSLYTFAADAPRTGAGNANLNPGTAIGDVGSTTYNQLNNRIGTWTASGGTNWDAGLYQMAQVGGSTKAFDLVIVITDGLPTYSLTGGDGQNTTVADTGNAVFSANALKAKGTRTIALGAGAGVGGVGAGVNLRAISGPNAYAGSNAQTADYFQTSWETLAPVLQQLAVGASCRSTVEVTKMADPFGSAPNAAANGWQFTAIAPNVSPANNVPTVANPTQTTAGTGASTGKASWTIQHSQLNGVANVTLTETVPTTAGQGWSLDDVTCTVNGATATASRNGLSVTISNVKVGDDVKCVVSNVQRLVSTMTIEKRAFTPTSSTSAPNTNGPLAALPSSGEIASGSTRTAGSAITYTYTVRNTGTSTLTNVAVTDNLRTTGPVCTLTTLAAGATAHCYWTPAGGLVRTGP